MSEGTTSGNLVGERSERSYFGRINFAGTMLRLTGGLGAAYCAVLIAGLISSWFALKLGRDGVYPLFGPRVIGYGLPLVAFLVAYAAGTVLPVLIKPARSNTSKE